MFPQAPILHSWRNYLSYIHILASTSVRFPTTLAQGLFGKRSQAKDVSAQMTSSTAAGRWRLLLSSFILSACQALQTRLDICQVVSMNPFPFVPHLPPTFPMHQYRSRWPHKMNTHPISSSNTKVSGDNCLTHKHIYIYIQSVASICITSTFWHTSPPIQPCSSGLPVQIWTYAPPPFPEAVDVGPSWIKQRMSKIVCFAGTNWQSSNLLEKTWLICLGVQARPQNAWKLRLICLGEILGNPILALFREISTSLDQQR